MLNTDKDKLRPVEFQEMQGGPKKKGWFHGWRKSTEYNDETVFALIEREDGSMTDAYTWAVKFLDRT